MIGLQTRPIARTYRSWAEGLTERLDRHRRSLSMLFSLLKAGPAYTPGFLFVAPLTPVPDLAADLAGLRRTPPAEVRADLNLLSWVLTTRGAAGVPLAGPRPGPGPLPEPLRGLYDNPVAGLREFARQLERYWSLAVEPLWGRIRGLMTADLVHRGRTDGADTALAELHPAVSWNSRGLTIEHSGAQGSHGMEGNELLLMPSAFTTADPWPISVPPHPPLLTYPVARDRGAVEWG